MRSLCCCVLATLLASCASEGTTGAEATPAEKPPAEAASDCTWDVLAYDKTDHDEIVAALTRQLHEAANIDRWAEENGHKPAVRFRRYSNQTPERIDLASIAKSLQKEMAESGRLDLLAEPGAELGAAHEETNSRTERGADLIGVIAILSFDDATPAERSRMYRVDMELVDSTTGDKVWIGSHQIQKMCELPAAAGAPSE